MIIESHAHYSHKRFDGAFRYLTGELTAREGQREDLLDRLRESGVVLSIEPAIDFESNRRTAALYRQHPDFIRLAVGVHPTRTHQAPWRQRRQLEVWAREPGVAAIGETGLDYHLPRKHRLTQLLWFRYQLGLARRLGLPLVLHIRMADRQNGIPVHVDISDLPMKRGIITNRNKFILGPSGSGKSFFTNHLVRNYYEQGAHILLVDTGNSYQGLCRMIHERTRGGDGIYITYEEDNPISFNPFYTDSGQFDVEKRESIKTLILTLWKREDEAPKRSEEVALSGAVNAYIRKITENREARPDFNGFYEFVDGDYRRMIAEKKVREKDFDIDGFLNVLEPFYKGGDYDFLLNSDRELDLTNRRFIVFELDNISGNKVLLPVVTLIIMETFIAKMRRLKGIRKVILIEECWKALMSANMSGYIQYLFKTVRKYFGEAVVVTQEVDDIISSPIVKEAIINNSDCKILLDQRKYMNKFEHIQRLLGLTEKEKSQILSINQANHPGRFYREVWIGLGGTRSAVYATEVSAEEYFTFTTEESEKLEVQRLAEELDGNLELAIRRMAERKREEQRQVSIPKREQ